MIAVLVISIHILRPGLRLIMWMGVSAIGGIPVARIFEIPYIVVVVVVVGCFIVIVVVVIVVVVIVVVIVLVVKVLSHDCSLIRFDSSATEIKTGSQYTQP